MADEIRVDLNKKNPLVEEDTPIEVSSIKIDKAIVEEVKKESKMDIPSEYIPITLVSNGRIKGIPKILHFRDFSVAESLDINTPSEEDKPKVISDVLTRMCFEKFDISKLPMEDILYILYVIHATFVTNNITKTIYLDEDLPEGTEKGQLYNEENMEEIDIPITSLSFTYLGKDKDDRDLDINVKIPFKIKDKTSGDTVEFKIATLEDSILAQNYCKNLFSDDLIKYSPIRKEINDINAISNGKKRDKLMDDLLERDYDRCNEYYKFMKNYNMMISQIIQALQIVSYNGKEIADIDEKWEIYSTKITSSLWDKYLKTTDLFPFGINNEVEVFSRKLNKKLTRTFGFQLFDFISIDRPKDSDRYDVLFD